MCSTCLQSGESNTVCAFRSNQMFFTEGRSKLRVLTSTPNLFYSFSPGKEEWFDALIFYFSNAEFYCLTCNLTLSFLLCFKVCIYVVRLSQIVTNLFYEETFIFKPRKSRLLRSAH